MRRTVSRRRTATLVHPPTSPASPLAPLSPSVRVPCLCLRPLTPGYSTVEVAVNGQDYTTSGVQVQVLQVSMTALHPSSGPVTGGTRVLVYGINVLDVFTCLFGGQAAAATETMGRNRIVCVTDSFAAPGWIAVQFAEGARQHTHAAPPLRLAATVRDRRLASATDACVRFTCLVPQATVRWRVLPCIMWMRSWM